MFHEENDTLELLDKYSKKNDPIKTKPLEKPKEKIIYRDMGKFTTKTDKKNNKSLLKIITIFVIAFISFAAYKNTSNIFKNPIIGKWKPINNNHFGNSELEFTEKRMFAFGMVGDVRYEEDGNKIIVFDKNGIFKDFGSVYIMKDKFTMESNTLGMITIYKKIE